MSDLYYRIKQIVDDVNALLDVPGDTVMLCLFGIVSYRLLHGPSITVAEASVIATYLGAFAYSNKGAGK